MVDRWQAFLAKHALDVDEEHAFFCWLDDQEIDEVGVPWGELEALYAQWAQEQRPETPTT